MIESDSCVTVEANQQGGNHVGSLWLVLECKQLALDFAKMSYAHSLREANEVVDVLAKNSFSGKCSAFWDSMMPDFTSQALLNDLWIF